MNNASDFIIYIADRTASRDVDGLADYFGLGQLIRNREITYKRAATELTAALEFRNVKATTAKTYLSQGASLAKLFDSLDELFDYADAECDGSRSMKRIYDSVKGKGKAKPKKALVDVVSAGLANLSDAAEIRRIMDEAAAMLKATEVPDAA